MSDWYGSSIYSGEEPLDYIDSIIKHFDLNNKLTTKLPTKFKEVSKTDTYVPYMHQKYKLNNSDIEYIKKFLAQEQETLINLANTPQKLITYGTLLLDYECEIDQNLYSLLKKASKNVMDFLNSTNEKFIPLKRERLDMNKEFFDRLKEINPQQKRQEVPIAIKEGTKSDTEIPLAKDNGIKESLNVGDSIQQTLRRKPNHIATGEVRNPEVIKQTIEKKEEQPINPRTLTRKTMSLKKEKEINVVESIVENSVASSITQPIEQEKKEKPAPKPRKPRVKKPVDEK